MGMGLGVKGRARGRGRAMISEINVTPMVDVMLVLLIIFMVAAPLMTSGVPLELPQSQASALPTQGKPLSVSVTTDGAIFVNDMAVTVETLVTTIGAESDMGIEQMIQVRGDAGTDYGMVMQVMGALAAAGYSRIGLVTELEKGP